MTRRAALWMIAGWARVAYLLAWLWSRPSYWQTRRQSRQINRFLADYARRGGSVEVKLYFNG